MIVAYFRTFTSCRLGYILPVFVLAVSLSPLTLAEESKAGMSLAERLQKINATNSSTDIANSSLKTPSNPLYNQVLKSVALIRCEGEDGIISGTGWVLNVEQRLIVTNHHVIEGFEECKVYFAEFIDGKLETDPNKSVVPARAIHGRVVDSDTGCDLAIVQLEKMPDGIPALQLADSSATPGQRIHSIAGTAAGTQSLWVYSTGYVRQVVRGVLANNHEAMVLESDMATNQGNSGGPVCDDQGHVVAVVEGHMTDARLVSIYVDLQSLAAYLADGLRCVDAQSADELAFSAKRHLQADRPQVALRLATAALKKNRDSAELYSLRGKCWLVNGDTDSAKGDFDDAIELDPHHSEAHRGLGDVAFDEEDYETSVEHYTAALRNEPENIDYLLSRGKARDYSGEFALARQDYESALKLNPNSIDAMRGRSIVDIELGDFAAGLNGLGQVVDFFNEDVETLYYVAQAMNGLDDFANAVEVLQKTISLDPEYSAAYQEIGKSFVGLEQYTDAIDVLSAAVELDPEDGTSHFYLGLSFIATEDLESGEIHLQEAARLADEYEDDELKASAQELLDELP